MLPSVRRCGLVVRLLPSKSFLPSHIRGRWSISQLNRNQFYAFLHPRTRSFVGMSNKDPPPPAEAATDTADVVANNHVSVDESSPRGLKRSSSDPQIDSSDEVRVESSQPSKKQHRGKKKSRPHENHTWRKKEPGDVNKGSYASAEQRKRFNVTLPEHVVLEGDALVLAPSKDDSADPVTAKRKLVFLLAYLGSKYGGFQMNDGQRTLQAEFEIAMLRGKLLNPLNFGNPPKYSWSTSGRTDKGVHACAQVVSAKVEMTEDQTVDNVREILNKYLPEDLIVLDAARTTRAFCAKTQRDRVRYQYMIPSFCLMERDKMREVFATAGIRREDDSRDFSEPPTKEESAKVQELVKDYRATPQQIARLQKALSEYEGTRPYHNFTKGMKPGEARAMRYIESFRVEDPIVYESVEWIPTQVLGQSFVLHQIRKMVCMAIDIARQATPHETMRRALSEKVLRINTGPAQGLFLEMSYYGGYNRRKSSNGNKIDLPDLDWHSEGTEAKGRWNDFRHDVIMQHIALEEAKEGNFVVHLYHQDFVNDLDKYYSGKWNELDGRAAQASKR